MTGRIVPKGHLQSVLNNGVGRYVCQLQRLTFRFCKHYDSSRGMREFIENHLVDFTRRYPGVVVYLEPKRHTRNATLLGEYLNGREEYTQVNGWDVDRVRQWVEHMRTQSGQEAVAMAKTWHTNNPSIQGSWNPWTNRDTIENVTTFPTEELSRGFSREQSTTDWILQAAKELREGKTLTQTARNYDVVKVNTDEVKHVP